MQRYVLLHESIRVTFIYFFSLASSVTLVEMMCMINASGNIFRFIGCRVKVWTNYYKITVQKEVNI